MSQSTFFEVFWPAWSSALPEKLIKKAFLTIGLWPYDAQKVLAHLPPTVNAEPHQASAIAKRTRIGQKEALPKANNLVSAYEAVVNENDNLRHKIDQLGEAIGHLNAKKKKKRRLPVAGVPELALGGLITPRKVKRGRAYQNSLEEQATADKAAKQANKAIQDASREAVKAANKVRREEAKLEREEKAREGEARKATRKAEAETRKLAKQDAQKQRDLTQKGKRKAIDEAVGPRKAVRMAQVQERVQP
jgi:hypothetical protein